MEHVLHGTIPDSRFKKHGGNYEKLFEKHEAADYGNDRL